jgi:hypothetical protein
MRSRMKAGRFELVPEVVEDLPAGGIVATHAEKTVDAEHAEPDGLHVEGRDGATERCRSFEKLVFAVGRRKILQQWDQRIQSCQ